MATLRRQFYTPRELTDSYKIFTHGGNYWRDLYLLYYWDRQLQPVVYRNEVYHGYKLLRRVRSWCWLTKDPKTDDFLTIKFLSRNNSTELRMFEYIQKHCKSSFVSTLRDQFSIPHHLSQTSPSKFGNIRFQAVVYPLTGICMGRIHAPGENHDHNPDIPLTLKRRLRYISQIIRGVSDLHSIGVVHADLHPGNITLSPPSKDHLAKLFAKPPLEHDVRLKDGSLPPPWMPRRVSEPEDIGFSPSGIKIIDFGYSFIPEKGCVYFSWHFPKGGLPAPELLTGQGRTALPFKADSWSLGNLIYFVLTGSHCFCGQDLNEYRLTLDELRAGQDSLINKLPEDVKSQYVPLILGLLEMDPKRRLAVEELSQEPYSEVMNVD